jgi:hypothetical protein
MAYEETQRQQGKALHELLRNIVEGQETAFDVVEDLTEQNGAGGPTIRLAVGQRRLNPEPPELPVKDRSPRRMHEFFEAAGFCRYLTKYGSDHTVILADAAAETVTAVLDETAGEGFELVTFRPQLHPRFAPWLAMLKATAAEGLPIKRFVEFVVAQRRDVYDPEPQALILMLQQVRLSRQVEIFQGIGKHSLNGITVVTDIGAGKTQNDLVELPDSLTIDVPLYLDLDTSHLAMDLILSGDEDGVAVRVVSSDLAVARVDAFTRFLNIIRESLDEQRFTVSLGKPRHEDWSTLDDGQ